MGNRQTPEVRFPGFSGEWKQRKLAEVAQYSNGGSFENEVVNKGKYELITLKSVDIDGNLIPSKKFINSEVSTLEKDTLVMILSEQAPGLLGKTSVIPFNNYYVLNQRVASLTPKEATDSNFLNKAINRNGKYFSSRGAGTKVQNISKPNVENFEFFIPEFKEQAKIGTFFKQLDNTITLHQQELTTLKQTKQGFLQKMFPKKGESVPEVRFSGFTGDWEQRKLGEISDKVTEKNKNNIYSETFTNSAEFGIINQRDFFDKDISNEKNLNGYYVVRPDDFVYNPRISNLAPVGPIKRNNLGRIGVMSPLYYVFRTHDVDNTYLEKYFSSNSWHIYMKLNGDSGARSDRFAIKDSLFREMPIPIPSIEEQNKIGTFFKQLDDTIALHQRELDALKETKKAFLQKMFV